MKLTFMPFNPESSISDRCREIVTKAVAKRHLKYFAECGDRLLCTDERRKERAVLTLLESAYGVNIGGQVFSKLTDKQMARLMDNCKAAYAEA